MLKGGGDVIIQIIYPLVESELGLNLQVCEALDRDIGGRLGRCYSLKYLPFDGE